MDVIIWGGGITRTTTLSRAVGPYKIAHWLRKNGYDCQVIDFIDWFSESQLWSATSRFITPKTLVLGISTTFLSNRLYKWSDGIERRIPEHAVNVLNRIKTEYPRLRTVLGGYMSDKLHGWGVIDHTVMDYAGASEDIFLEYVDHLRTGSPAPHGRVQTVWGNATRIVYDKAKSPKYNIEMDDFHFVKQDVILKGEVLPLDVSRGCIFACRFCQYPHLGKKKMDYVRHQSLLESEIIYNAETFGSKRYLIMDDTFNDTEWKVKNFHDMTQRLDFKIDYAAYLRADLLQRFPDMTYMLQESGLFGAFHGIETLHPAASKLVGKGWSGTHAREYIPRLYHDIWKGEIAQHLSFIVGLPGESEEDIYSTHNWFIDNQLHSCDFKALGLFGPTADTRYTIQSEFDKNAEKYGFTFVDDGGINGRQRRWKNDKWTLESALAVSNKINKLVTPANKIEMWAAIPMLWYNWSKEDVLKKYVTEYPWESVRVQTQELYQQYYETLMTY